MPDAVLVAVVSGVLLGLWGLLGWTRRRFEWGAALVVLALGFALWKGVLVPRDATTLAGHAGLGGPVLSLVLWSAYGAVARAAGRPFVPGPPWLVAPLCGALVGEIPASALLGASARDPSGAARLALAAAGGAMVGRVADPALLVLGSHDLSVTWALAPLGILFVVVAGPRRDDLPAAVGAGRTDVLAVSLAVGVASLVPGAAPWALGAGVAAMAWVGRARWRSIDWKLPASVSVLVVLSLIAVAAGVPEWAALGLETWHEEFLDPHTGAALAAAGALVAAASDGAGSALFGAAMLDRALSYDAPRAALAFAAGAAAGGLGPLLAAGALPRGLGRWAVQVALAVAWGWLLCRWA